MSMNTQNTISIGAAITVTASLCHKGNRLFNFLIFVSIVMHTLSKVISLDYSWNVPFPPLCSFNCSFFILNPRKNMNAVLSSQIGHNNIHIFVKKFRVVLIITFWLFQSFHKFWCTLDGDGGAWGASEAVAAVKLVAPPLPSCCWAIWRCLGGFSGRWHWPGVHRMPGVLVRWPAPDSSRSCSCL